jgi:PAS domain S-box-containing protein
VSDDDTLFEDAPCGYLITDPGGRILRANRTFASWTGHDAGALPGRRIHDLLAPGARIYYETHVAPLLQMQGSISEIALEVVRADGSRLPALVNATLQRDEGGTPRTARVLVFDATDRRRYERELLRLRDRERDVAARLQASLLGGALPDDDQVEVGVAYVPSDVDLQVGGDWYDAFWGGDGRLAIVVGDVVGRGIAAAAAMGQLRSAVRALASTGLAPAALLTGLDAYVDRHGVGEMSTVAFARLDAAAGSLQFACAGHMPPVLVAPGLPPRYLPGGRTAPLNAYPAAVQRTEATAPVPAGSTLVLYTDGLIERVDRPLAEGLDALLEAIETRRAAPPQRLADDLVEAMLVDRAARDDVCVLALRLR